MNQNFSDKDIDDMVLVRQTNLHQDIAAVKEDQKNIVTKFRKKLQRLELAVVVSSQSVAGTP